MPATQLYSVCPCSIKAQDFVVFCGGGSQAAHQQKITLRQIRRRCVLTHATLNLCPLRPVRPELRRLRPVHPELRRLRPVCPEFPRNALSNSMHLEPNQYTTFRHDILVKATLPLVHPDWSINTIGHHDLPLRDARFRGTPEYFLAQFIMVSRHLASHVTRHTVLSSSPSIFSSLIIALNIHIPRHPA